MKWEQLGPLVLLGMCQYLNQQTCHYIVFQVCSCWLWELLKWAPFPAGYMLWLLWKKHRPAENLCTSWSNPGNVPGARQGGQKETVPLWLPRAPAEFGGCCLVLLLAPASPSTSASILNSLTFWEEALIIRIVFRCFLSPAYGIWVWLLVSPQNCVFLSTFPESIHC